MHEAGRWTCWVGRLLLAGAVLAAWEAAVATAVIDGALLPPPSAVALRLAQWATEPDPYRHLAVTAFEVLMGYSFGSLFGGLAGIVLSAAPRFAAGILDEADTVATIAPPAAAPLLVYWLGPGVGSAVWLAALLVGSASLVEVRRTLLGLDPAIVANARMLGAGRFAVVRHLLVPVAEDRLLALLRPAVRRATVGALICEFLGASSGLGSLVLHSTRTWDPVGACAAIAVLAGVSLLADRCLAATERRLAPWRFRPRHKMRNTPLFQRLEGG